jgi:putative transposase
MICGFIDAMRADGHGVEATCAVLRSQGLTVALRSYRAWNNTPACDRDRSDAAIVDALRRLRTGGPEEAPLPEVLYGRRKMTAWLRRNGFPQVSLTLDIRLTEADVAFS